MKSRKGESMRWISGHYVLAIKSLLALGVLLTSGCSVSENAESLSDNMKTAIRLVVEGANEVSITLYELEKMADMSRVSEEVIPDYQCKLGVLRAQLLEQEELLVLVGDGFVDLPGHRAISIALEDWRLASIQLREQLELYLRKARNTDFAAQIANPLAGIEG